MLRFWMTVSGAILEVGFFSIIFGVKLELVRYFGSDDPAGIVRDLSVNPNVLEALVVFAREKGLPALLALYTFVWYFLYKRAVKNEMEVLIGLYSRFNPPHDWENIVGRHWIPFLSVGLTITFLGLAWFIDKIEVYCLLVLVLNVLDIRGNTVVRKNLVEHFRDERFLPRDDDLHKEFILGRRKIADEYWVQRPQLERIGAIMIATAGALLLALSQPLFSIEIWRGAPYLLMVVAITCNEVTMSRWRAARDRALNDIEEAEETANRARTGELLGRTSR